MKTSIKMLLSMGVLALVFLLISLPVLRKELWANTTGEDLQWQTFSVGKFGSLEFSPNWQVSISQGEDYKVEIGLEEGAEGAPEVQNRQGSLYFDASPLGQRRKRARLRITAPRLQQIKTGQGSSISMHKFRSDSLRVILDKGGRLSGKENKFEFISLAASGDATYRFFENELETVELNISDKAAVRVNGNRILGNITDQAKVFVVGDVNYLGVQIKEGASLRLVEPDAKELDEM